MGCGHILKESASRSSERQSQTRWRV